MLCARTELLIDAKEDTSGPSEREGASSREDSEPAAPLRSSVLEDDVDM